MNNTEVANHLETIANYLLEHYPELPMDSAFFAGGCIRDLLRDQTPKDYDIFFTNQAAVQAIDDYFKRCTTVLNPFIMTKNANWNLIVVIGNQHYTIQFVTCNFGNITTLVNSFDFTINSSYYDIPFGQLTVNSATLQNVLLPCSTTNKPLGALCRIPKFIKKGYEVPNNTIVTLVERATGKEFSDEELDGMLEYDEPNIVNIKPTTILSETEVEF